MDDGSTEKEFEDREQEFALQSTVQNITSEDVRYVVRCRTSPLDLCSPLRRNDRLCRSNWNFPTIRKSFSSVLLRTESLPRSSDTTRMIRSPFESLCVPPSAISRRFTDFRSLSSSRTMLLRTRSSRNDSLLPPPRNTPSPATSRSNFESLD